MPPMEAPPLKSPLDMSRGSIYSQKSLASVGGIAFELEAVPVESLLVESLALSYNPQQEDGSRFLLSVNDKAVYAELYDWQLIPIAFYADSPYFACFTFFGHLLDKQQEKSVREKGGKIVNHHPALLNTLLGLRLMQSDLLLMYGDCADLPKKGNTYILGNGESEPDVWRNRNGLNNIIRKLQNMKSDHGMKYRSYLISDYKQDIRFSIQNDTLQIRGNPFFYCWHYKYEEMGEAKQLKFQKKVISDIDQELGKANKQSGGTFNRRSWYIEKLLIELKRYEESYRIYSAGTVIDVLRLNEENARRSFLDRYATSSLQEILVDLIYNMAMHEPVFLKEYSEQLSANPVELRAMNPAVWDATTNTMRFAAFFRYCKSHFSDEWQIFLKQIDQVSIEPGIVTPTVIFP
ncbi:hypothetical protein H8E88_30005 [candidate division KSB1 bacterium]|nr:hypothetical protein [candidate division KSB1 bacterium]